MSKVLAVYGTLRYGAPANGFMRECEYLGQDKIQGRLYNLGSYPGLRIDRKEDRTPLGDFLGKEEVTVDLYKVPEGKEEEILPVLDRYEGYCPEDGNQSMYIRKKVLTLEGTMEVETYEYNAIPPPYTLIESGDWFDAM